MSEILERQISILRAEFRALQARLDECLDRVDEIARATAEENPIGQPLVEPELPCRWKAELETSPLLFEIGDGIWRRNGHTCAWSADVPAGSWTVGINYVTAILDDPAAPTTVSVEVGPAAPEVEDGSEKVVALVTYDGTVLTEIVQCLFSDIDDTWFPEPATPALELYWDGVLATCRPPTPIGHIWEVVAVDGLKIYNESRCLATIDLPGYCPVNDSLTLIDSDGEAISVEFVDGKATLPEGTVISGIDAATGDAVYLTAEADGSLSGFVGVMAIMDPDTGESSNYRVSSSGIMEA